MCVFSSFLFLSISTAISQINEQETFSQDSVGFYDTTCGEREQYLRPGGSVIGASVVGVPSVLSGPRMTVATYENKTNISSLLRVSQSQSKHSPIPAALP